MPSTVLMLSPTVLKLSDTVLNSLHSAEGIPDSTEAISHMYCSYPPPTVLMLSPTCTDVIPHCTEQPPQY